MNLAFCLFNYFPFGGLERNFLAISQECIKRGHTIDVYTISWDGGHPNNINVNLIPARGFSNHSKAASFARHLIGILDRSRYDLVVGFNKIPAVDLYYAADVCYVLDIARRRTLLSRMTPRYRIYAKLERSVFGSEAKTHIMYLSETEKNNYIRAYRTPEERFHYLPPGIDKDQIRAATSDRTRQTIRRELNLDDHQFMLLMIGSDFRRKGVSRTIAAAASLPGNLRNRVELFIIGKGKNRPFIHQAAKAGIGGRVHFLGARSDVPRFLAGADLLLHPAVTENTGNVILESMVAGVPVLATEICGYAFHVKAAHCGLIVPEAFRQDEMNKLLSQLLAEEDLKKLGRNGSLYSDITDLYSRYKTAAKIIEDLAGKEETGAIT